MRPFLASVLTSCVILGGISLPAAATPVQWEKTSGGNGHFYEAVNDKGSWTDAIAAAQASSMDGFRAHLATFTSLDEFSIVQSLIALFGQGDGVNNRGFYLGASDAETEGNWKWVAGPETGTSLFFANHEFPWVSYQPDNRFGNQNYMITFISDGTNGGGTVAGHAYLDDTDIDGNAGYVIEYSPIPLPSSLLLLLSALIGLIAFAPTRRRRV